MESRTGTVLGGRIERVPRALRVLAASFALVLFGHALVFEAAREPTVVNAIIVVTNGVCVGGVAYVARRLERGDLDPRRYPRVFGWCVGGSTVFLLVNLGIQSTMWPIGALPSFRWLLFAAASGAVGGALVGLVEARAIQRAVEHERAVVRAEAAEERGSWLDYLNALLRHEVLNTANVIMGVAEMAREQSTEPSVRDDLDTVIRRSSGMTDVVRDVRALIQATRNPDSLRAVDLPAVVESEVTELRETYPSVTVTTSVPGRAAVRADDLLNRVLANLLTNAVEHSGRETPHVHVAVETGPETTVIRVEDDGNGVDPAVRDGLFERGTRGDHGLGLYLVSVLVDRYGGRVELTETGPDGSTFSVFLPTVPAEGPVYGRASDDSAGVAWLEAD